MTLTGEIRIDYAQDAAGTHHAVLQISPDGVKMLVQTPDGEQVLKHDPCVPEGTVLFTRRGNYARVRYGSRELWLQGGTGEWYGHCMAEEAVLTVEDRNDELTGCTYSSLEWLKAPDAPVVSAGDRVSLGTGRYTGKKMKNRHTAERMIYRCLNGCVVRTRVIQAFF